jgi:hypothetical protein
MFLDDNLAGENDHDTAVKSSREVNDQLYNLLMCLQSSTNRGFLDLLYATVSGVTINGYVDTYLMHPLDLNLNMEMVKLLEKCLI